MSRLTRALQHRNYRLFFAGQSVSLIGTWVTRIATSWLVYRLTGSELLLGLTGFAGQIPLLLLAPFAGVLADRWNRHRILVITQVLSALQSLALGVLALSGKITVTHVILLQIAQGIINSFDTPARQAFVVEMVEDRADVPNAIALNSSMFNASRIIGPSIGGVIIAAVGEGWCFIIDAISYVAVIASLVAMRLPPRTVHREREPLLSELRSGFDYVFGFAPVRELLLNVAIVGVMGMPYAVLMPVFASKILHGGAYTQGLLMTATGAGALAGTVYLASRHSVLGLGKVIIASTLLLSVGLIIFANSNTLPLSLAVLPLVGAGMMLQAASANTILQTIVDEHLRGRVMAFYSVAVLGTMPIGSLVAGMVAERIGAPRTIVIGAIACILAAVWFAIRRPKLIEHVRPIYIERGILEAVEERVSPVA
ncbi:MAG: MFS transporter [Thermoanaerobaculia bacterium]